jgi:hypothetical protein
MGPERIEKPADINSLIPVQRRHDEQDEQRERKQHKHDHPHNEDLNRDVEDLLDHELEDLLEDENKPLVTIDRDDENDSSGGQLDVVV